MKTGVRRIRLALGSAFLCVGAAHASLPPLPPMMPSDDAVEPYDTPRCRGIWRSRCRIRFCTRTRPMRSQWPTDR